MWWPAARLMEPIADKELIMASLLSATELMGGDGEPGRLSRLIMALIPCGGGGGVGLMLPPGELGPPWGLKAPSPFMDGNVELR